MASSITDFLIRVKVQGQQAIDNLTKSTNAAEKSMDKASATSGKLGNALKGLGSTIASTASTGSNFADNILGGVGRMGGVAGAGLALASTAFVALGLKAISAADAIQDISDATGISAGRLLNFKESILNAGGKTEDFEKVALKLTQTLGDAASGNEKVRKSFKDLGVSLGDANGNLRSTDQLLPEIIQALSNIEDPAERSAKAVDLLGKSAARIDWTQVKAINDPFKDQEIAQLAKYQAAIDKITYSIESKLIGAVGKLFIAIENGGVISGTANWLDSFVSSLQHSIIEFIEGKEAADKFYESLMRFRGKVGAAAEMKPGQMPLPAGMLPSNVEGGRGNINPPMASEINKGTGQLSITEEGMKAIAIAKSQTTAMRETNIVAIQYANTIANSLLLSKEQADVVKITAESEKTRLTQINEINKKIAEETANKERDSRVTGEIVKQLEEQRAIVNKNSADALVIRMRELGILQQQREIQADIVQASQSSVQQLQMLQLGNQSKLIGLYGDELKAKQGIMAIDNERTLAVLNAENKLKQMGKDATAGDRSRALNEIAMAKDASDQKIQILKDQIAAETALRNNAKAGAMQALEQITRSMDPFQVAQQKVNSMWGTMENAIDKFVETGKFDFRDFTNSIIQDMIKIELKAAASKLFTGLMSSGSSFLTSLLGFANGGTPPLNKPSIVGEKGPEIFMPRGAGTVIPNDKLGSSGNTSGGQISNTYVTNNISAVDAKSVAQLFADNRQMLLGSVKMAEKELPYRMR